MAVAARGDRGATAVEYAVMLAMIAAVIILAVTSVGLKTLANFTLPSPF